MPPQLAVKLDLHLVFLQGGPRSWHVVVCPLEVSLHVLMLSLVQALIVFICFVQYVVQYDACNYPLRNALATSSQIRIGSLVYGGFSSVPLVRQGRVRFSLWWLNVHS